MSPVIATGACASTGSESLLLETGEIGVSYPQGARVNIDEPSGRSDGCSQLTRCPFSTVGPPDAIHE